MKNFENKTVDLSISDVAGKIIAKETIHQATATPHRLSIATLENGIYFVKIETAGKRMVVRKLQVLK